MAITWPIQPLTKVSAITLSSGPALKNQHHGALWGSSCFQNASYQLDRVEIGGDGSITIAGFISHSIRSSGVMLPTRTARSGGFDADELFDASFSVNRPKDHYQCSSSLSGGRG